ncbi:MAG: FtsX-like permease family protein [Lachnospiraceae bacterium]
MQGVLRKRVFRDLKNNLSRCLALFGLVVLAMYMIVGIVAAAENVTVSVEQGAQRNHMEDGTFTVFIPLEETELTGLEEKGVSVERMFYLDYLQNDESTVRVYQDRQQINLLELKKGNLPLVLGEIVVEEQYATKKGIQVGDSLELGGISFTITGIVTTPDYDSVLQEMSTSYSDSSMFGTAFVCEEQYEALREAGNASKSEIYAYSYFLGDKMLNDELKDDLTDLSFDQAAVEDVYFREMMDTYEETKTEIQDGIIALSDGGNALWDGLQELASRNDELLEGYNEIFDAYLADATEQLEDYQVGKLKQENYQSVLQELMNQDQLLKEQLEPVLEGLDGLKEYQDAVNAYTEGVSSLQNGATTINDGTGILDSVLGELTSYHFDLQTGAATILQSYLSQTSDALSSYGLTEALSEDNYEEVLSELIAMAQSSGNAELSVQLESALRNLNSIKDYKDAINNYTAGVDSVKAGADSLASGTQDYLDGTVELAGYSQSLVGGASQIFEANLTQVNEQLKEYGFEETVTKDTYQSVLNRLMGTAGDDIVRSSLQDALDGLTALGEYQDALVAYTDAVNEAADGSKELTEGIDELKEKTDELIDEIFTYEADNLVQFVTAENNPRIAASIDDKVIDKYAGLMAGVIVTILIAYVLSVYSLHAIETEEPIIGTFYALGVNKRLLVRHYLTLPLLITVLGCFGGTVLGFSVGAGIFTETSSDYFSLPLLINVYPIYLMIYGLLMPPLIALLVNYLVINKKLGQPVLKLMRKDSKNGKRRQVHFKRLGYIKTFQIHHFLREIRSGLTVLFGMFIALLVFMLGMDTYVLCENIIVQNKRDANFQYIYTFKYPEEEVPEGGTAFYLESLNKVAYGNDLDVSLLGMENGNDYFDFVVPQAKNEVVISDAVATKFQLKVGDKLILTDEVEDQDYAFTVEAITPYSIGLYVFMDLDSMRELFGQEEDYYNMVYAKRELDIASGRLYATMSRADVAKSSEVFSNMMGPMIYTMIGISIFLFMMVMYLMMKVMIDRSAHEISMMKVFGYRKKEIRKLYLDANLLWIFIAAIICIPGSKLVMDLLYPTLIANASIGGDLTFTWQLYLSIFLGVMICYFVINLLLVRRLNHFLPADILKDRE